ncbi:MAG: hypothetical protein JW860_03815 [Sedimentisphaerales bacterium]|nr:hypothetical protein [Sedimentisphaerales bacterium]
MRYHDGISSLTANTSPGLTILTLPRPSFQEYFINAVPVAGESLEAIFTKAQEFIRDHKALIISQDVFGITRGDGSIKMVEENIPGRLDWPVTWVEDGDHPDLCGTHIWAVSGIDIETIAWDGRTVGCTFEDHYGRYCRLGDIRPKTAEGTRSKQARFTLELMEQILETTGMDFSHVIRTWFYNHDILDWYGEFNRVRNQFFRERKVYDNLVPASTGIGGRNPAGTALVGGLLAVKLKIPDSRAFAIASPLQGAALDYGSSFSRAVELVMPDHRRLFVSGTASINPNGDTMNPGDVDAQVDLTMRVVGAILESRGMSWQDIVRALAYFRQADDVPALGQYCSCHNLESWPVIVINNVVCREDLLFEIEVDAVQKSPPPD